MSGYNTMNRGSTGSLKTDLYWLVFLELVCYKGLLAPLYNVVKREGLSSCRGDFVGMIDK